MCANSSFISDQRKCISMLEQPTLHFFFLSIMNPNNSVKLILCSSCCTLLLHLYVNFSTDWKWWEEIFFVLNCQSNNLFCPYCVWNYIISCYMRDIHMRGKKFYEMKSKGWRIYLLWYSCRSDRKKISLISFYIWIGFFDIFSFLL